MFRWLSNLFGVSNAGAAESAKLRTELQATQKRLATEVQSRRLLKASYDAAQTRISNERHWSAADGLSAAGANNHGVRRTLRNRSRFEADNGGYYGGICRQYANDHSGTGPVLQIQDDDDAAAADVEAAWKGWCKAVGLGRKLWTMTQAKIKDGEAFAVLTTNPGIADAVKLDVRLVEAEQVTDPHPWVSGTTGWEGRYAAAYWDGIRYDDWGNPVSYAVLRHHPGDTISLTPWEHDDVPARYVLHWFRADRPGQLRGVPELTASLPVGAYLRRWNLATLAAAETAAEIAAYIKTPAPAGSEAEQNLGKDVEPFESFDMERGTIMALPVGTDIGQVTPSQPGAQYETFKRENVAEMARPVGMPVNVATADSSRHNFSSAKLDHFGYRGGIRVERSFAEDPVVEKVYLAWLEEARLVPGYLGRAAGRDVAAMTRKWGWPGWASMDKDEAKSDTERLNNGTDNLSDILGEWGLDWRDVIRQRGKELKFLQEEGVPPPPTGGAAAPFGGPKQPAVDVAPVAAAHANGHANGHAPVNRLPAAVPGTSAAARAVLLAVGRLLGDAP